MELKDVMKELETYGNEGTRRVYTNHGAREPLFGVKIGDLKKVLKKTKTNHDLALALYDTGNSDAMYLAGLMADESKTTKATLRKWVKGAYWYMLSESTVAGLAAESPHGLELAREWIESKKEMVASAGWATHGGILALEAAPQPPKREVSALLTRVKKEIHHAPNRVRYSMNNFVISVGSYIPELLDRAVQVAEAIGKVRVEMGKTECKVPFAPDYIRKIEKMGRVGKKRRNVRC